MFRQISQKDCLRLAFEQRIGSLSVGPRIRQRYVFRKLSYCNPDGKRILDAGCGDGTCAFILALRFPKIEITGIDLDETRIAKAIQYSRCPHVAFNGKFRVGSITELPAEAFDIIYCIDVLEHISDDARVIQNFYEALYSNGTLILHVPLLEQKRYLPWLRDWKQEDHVRDGYEKENLRQMIQRSGFTVIESRLTFGSFGALAWDIEETCRAMNKFVRFMALPLLILLTEIEFRWPNRSGNAVLVTARKE